MYHYEIKAVYETPSHETRVHKFTAHADTVLDAVICVNNALEVLGNTFVSIEYLRIMEE